MEERHENSNMAAIMVIFGGTGDLTARKLLPALYNLVCEERLPENFAVVAVGRKEKTTDEYHEEAFNAINTYSRNILKEDKWQKLQRVIYYMQFDFLDENGYQRLKTDLEQLDATHNTGGNRIFYLAVAPDYFEPIVHGLQVNQLANTGDSWQRLVIEKPFGKDLYTAKRLNGKLNEVFAEKNIYRIDHYLGKEMIQNIMVLRFCNSVFESLWSNKYIDNIQILLSEQEGVGTRGGYYETSGAMRDMVQNHILQTLSLIAMEPPVKLSTDAIRSEKLKVIQSIQEFTPAYIRENVVFGQYGSGEVGGKLVPTYRDEAKIAKNSNTETFIAMKLYIQNFRWAGTPFYIRTGKRLNSKEAKIMIQFKALPPVLYFENKQVQEPNVLVIKIQPEVGVGFQFNTKKFGTAEDIVSAKMETGKASDSGNTPEAYERLIRDILRGDTTLFSRWDEVEAAWSFADNISAYQKQRTFDFPNYKAGTMGPYEAFELITRDGRLWWEK